MEIREKYIARIINDPAGNGFTEVKMINAPQVTTSRWTRQRCWYLCRAANDSDTTPPRSPDRDSTLLTLEEYRFGLMLRREVSFPFPPNFTAEWEDFQDAVVRVEEEAFKRGYGKAFAMGCGNCLFGHHDDSLRPCSFPGKRRPTLEAIGVNLHDTLTMLDWQDYLVRDSNEPFQLFALVMLE